jgi:hypothetical protein
MVIHLGTGLAGLLVVLAVLQPAYALRCDRRVVDEQDTVLEVLGRCGEPALRDRHPPANLYGQGFFGYPDETWYYNFGPQRLLHILSFRNNRLIRIETDGYGFNPPANSACFPGNIGVGMSKLRLLSSCGEPAQRSQYYQLQPLFRHGEIVGQVGVLRESWHYNFGKRRLLREVILEDGKVTEIKTATSHGY